MKILEESERAISIASQFLYEGKVISFATDTVYGLAADATNFRAVEALYKIKNRDSKKPIAIFVKDLAAAKKIFLFDELSQKIAEKFLPGSLTLVLKINAQSSCCLASNLNENDDQFLGFRIVNHQFTQNLLEEFGGILAVTSANPSNQEAAVNAEQVKKYFAKSNLDLLVDSGKSAQSLPSTVVKISNQKLTILRQGALEIKYENI